MKKLKELRKFLLCTEEGVMISMIIYIIILMILLILAINS